MAQAQYPGLLGKSASQASMKEQFDALAPAGMQVAERKLPVEHRFDQDERLLRNNRQATNIVNLNKQNRMMALIQQQDHVDNRFKNQLIRANLQG